MTKKGNAPTQMNRLFYPLVKTIDQNATGRIVSLMIFLSDTIRTHSGHQEKSGVGYSLREAGCSGYTANKQEQKARFIIPERQESTEILAEVS